MRQISVFWTCTGTALAVFLGAALGGLGLVDMKAMFAIMLVPQVVFWVYGQWPQGANSV